MSDVSMRNFLQEEVAIMSCYNITSKQTLIDSIQEALPHVENGASREFMYESIQKLQRMSDASYRTFKELLIEPKVF